MEMIKSQHLSSACKPEKKKKTVAVTSSAWMHKEKKKRKKKERHDQCGERKQGVRAHLCSLAE